MRTATVAAGAARVWFGADGRAWEAWTYREDFEGDGLGAWASYPLWQDAAYDQNLRPNALVPGDPNIALEQRVTPYRHGEAYAGVQKRLHLALHPGASVSLRFYLKTHLPCAEVTLRLAAGSLGTLDCAVAGPPTNQWVRWTVTCADLRRANPKLAATLAAADSLIEIHAVALLARLAAADPAMPFYLGLDDVVVQALRPVAFRFREPAMHTLPEWRPRIPAQPYERGARFALAGTLPCAAERVAVQVTPFPAPGPLLLDTDLRQHGHEWVLDPVTLDWPAGLYHGRLRASQATRVQAETEFTLLVTAPGLAGRHPRLWFDAAGCRRLQERLRTPAFAPLAGEIATRAEDQRRRVPPASVVFDSDQFPAEDWLPSWDAFSGHLYHTGEALFWNAFAYALQADQTAGQYAREVLLRLAGFPHFSHPWQHRRRRFSEHRTGDWSSDLAIAYDLVHGLLTAAEARTVRRALWTHLVDAAHRMYSVDDNVTCNTSNWVGHVLGGALAVQAAIYADGTDAAALEPHFTGAVLKLHDFLQRTATPDGAYGEGLGYHAYSLNTLSRNLPALERVFGVHLADPLRTSFDEHIWAGLIRSRRCFHFGDSRGELTPLPALAWLVQRYRDPRLAWLRQFLATSTQEPQDYRGRLLDLLYDTRGVPRQAPFAEAPVRVFRNVGTTVFKSGWGKRDFVFVLRSGPFYNHQHLDQGSFWLADRGTVFIGERSGSTYYEDPLYQPSYIQPVAHSTVLIDGNPQSQRTGDPAGFAPGFEDRAFVGHFLDGGSAAFVTGDLGRLYWGKVRALRRHVLYLKPRTVLMLDEVVPGETDAEVTLLYQAERLQDIQPGVEVSRLAGRTGVLHLAHLHPRRVHTAAVETPHYLLTLRQRRPLVAEGMLTLTTRTHRRPLLIANLLRVTAGAPPRLRRRPSRGCVQGQVDGQAFAFSTAPGRRYRAGAFSTDALALAWTRAGVFAAECTLLRRNGRLLLAAPLPVTADRRGRRLRCYITDPCTLCVGVSARPVAVLLNGRALEHWTYDPRRHAVSAAVPAGETEIRWVGR